MKKPELWQNPFLHSNLVRSKNKISTSIDVQRFVGENDSGMCSGCSVVNMIPDVIVANESCMICGFLSCGGVRSTRCIVMLIIMPHRDYCFILTHTQSMSVATLAAGM